jgi:hypothetical protein
MSELRVLNLGAGVQSTVLYLMAVQDELRFDVAIFADTQDEPREVYRHLEWLKTLGGPRIVTATAGRLGDDLVHGRNTTGGLFAAIPAFTTPDGGVSVGMTRRQCSKEYKTEVIGRTIRRDVLGLKPRQRVPKGMQVFQSLGISMDEGGRARRIKALFAKEHKWATPVFPLLDRFMTRADCLTWLVERGNVPHDVPRSACVFCPYHSDTEWLRVKSDPVDWARAVEIDRALRTTGTVANRDMRQVMYLHDSCRPLEEVELKEDPRERQMPMSFYKECEGVCGV